MPQIIHELVHKSKDIMHIRKALTCVHSCLQWCGHGDVYPTAHHQMVGVGLMAPFATPNWPSHHLENQKTRKKI
jgi:hypothetical protein